MLGVSNCEIDSKKSAGAVTTSISHTSFSKGSPFWPLGNYPDNSPSRIEGSS